MEKGNPIIPEAPVPSIVRMSMVPKPPDPIAKVGGVEGLSGEEVEDIQSISSTTVDEEMDARPKGTIVIKVFENSPYEVEFSGIITGSEVDIAWKAMMKEYRVWKHNLFKKETEAKNDGGV